jgi:hypothetical protein
VLALWFTSMFFKDFLVRLAAALTEEDESQDRNFTRRFCGTFLGAFAPTWRQAGAEIW